MTSLLKKCSKSLLEVKNLNVSVIQQTSLFKKEEKKILKNNSFSIREGETLGLVGESGCGKSTLSKTIMNLTHLMIPFSKVKGSIQLHYGDTVYEVINRNKKRYNRKKPLIQMIFQDLYNTLNPRMTIYDILMEPLNIWNKSLSKEEKEQSILSKFDKVGLKKDFLSRYPFEFSGGQRQRIAITKALLMEPLLLIADEPVSALDISIQSQILNLIQNLQKEFKLSLLFVSHDLSVVKYLSDRIMVLYGGQIVEIGPATSVYKNPLHPYTKLLLDSVPKLGKQLKPAIRPRKNSDFDSNKTCGFQDRCPIMTPACFDQSFDLKEINPDHYCSCPFI